MARSNSPILSGLMGLCIGDALGVPVEFTSRSERTQDPVTDMRGYGTWNQPPGTWSDDSSLAFCLAEALCDGFSLEAIAHNFCQWYQAAYWTPHQQVFDIGNATREAIVKLQGGASPLAAGGTSDRSNGNGSLMRILPMAFLHQIWDFSELLQRVHQVSCLTHAHPRSQIACGIYISIAMRLLQGASLPEAYLQGIEPIELIYAQEPFSSELPRFERVMAGTIAAAPIDAIHSSGYVLDTLEAALWCLLNTASYADAVLQAVNLGSDTDTTAAVTGGLAGIYYGFNQIPAAWRKQIARQQDIVDLCDRLTAAIAHQFS